MDSTQILIDELRSNRKLRFGGRLNFGIIFSCLISAVLVFVALKYLLSLLM